MKMFLPSVGCALLLAFTAHAEDVQFVSAGKFLVGRPDFSGTLDNGNPIPDSLYGTACEIMMGTQNQKHAATRVHSLHPDFAPHAVKIQAERIPNTSLLVVRVISEDGIYARTIADAVMDEFLALQTETKANSHERQVVWIQDEMVHIEKDIMLYEDQLDEAKRAKANTADLEKVKATLKRHTKRYDALFAMMGTLADARILATDVFTTIEHASEAEKVQKAP